MAYDVSLSALRSKVRRLSRVLSPNQVTNNEIDNYINMALLFDFPSHLKLFTLRKTFTFYTEPNVDTYSTNTIDTDSPMYNFKNLILQSSDPIYIGGYQASFSQSRQEFFIQWPIVQYKQQIATGDGVTTNFTGTLSNIPMLSSANQVLFTSADSDGEGIGLTSLPVLNSVTGTQTPDGNFYTTIGPIPSTLPTVVIATNTINFITGIYNITFDVAPAASQPIYAQNVQYVASRPQSVLFFDNTFTLRPVPDGVYPVVIESQVRPTELISANQVPDLEQWFEFIAYLAAKKVCEDRNDMETIQILMPSLEEQKMLVERRTLIQQGDKRSATIYSQQAGLTGYYGPFMRWW